MSDWKTIRVRFTDATVKEGKVRGDWQGQLKQAVKTGYFPLNNGLVNMRNVLWIEVNE